MMILDPPSHCIEIENAPGYAVGTDGSFWSVQRSSGFAWGELSIKPKSHGYVQIKMFINGKRVGDLLHRVIARAFIGEIPKGHVVNHKNGIKHDNRVDNLEIITAGDNVRHAITNGLHRNSQFL